MAEDKHYTGHRARLRERFLRGGLPALADYEALELLLTYAIPRRDVKPIAKALIKRFGSVSKALDAPAEELQTVKGVSEYTAAYMKALRECAALYLRERKVLGRTVLSSASDVMDYCSVQMGGLRDEQFRVLFLNSSNEVISDEAVAEGTVNETTVPARKVLERALHHKATALILVHNHPGGSCRPSNHDKALTAELVRVAASLQIVIHDHLIVSGTDTYSFRAAGLIR